ncbi:MAG: C69 family dipeptidase [Bacteroidales bacterium]|jgi:dipeptidase|nr:C69 family dipeptidase [Bacteroidales bacterium]
MKRILFTLLTAVFLLFHMDIQSCTNFLVTPGASANGTSMITYAADAHVLYGELYFTPAAYYPAGTMLSVIEWDTHKFLGQIKQVSHTYSVVGNMNEHQVAIGETTYGGRPELRDTTGIVDYGSLMYITMQRAKTAREAIQIMGELVKEYGYYSSGESFSISDPNEVWIMEIIGKGTEMVTKGKGSKAKTYNKNKGAVWVAVRIPDGYVSGHANQARIQQFPQDDPENCLYAPDVISFAREKGYYEGGDEDFSFSDTYAPVDFGGARFCEMRVWSFFKDVNSDMQQYFDYASGHDLDNRMPLYIKPDKKVSNHDLMNFMRDHLEGTELDMTKDAGAGPFGLPYRWRPLYWEVDGNTYCNERATATQQTGFSFVAESRSGMPDIIGGILWFGVDDAASTVYVPMYCGITKAPESYKAGNGDLLTYSETSAFWTFSFVSNFAYLRYNLIMEDVKEKQTALETGLIKKVKSIDEKAIAMYKEDPEAARAFVTNFSASAADHTVAVWKELGHYLLVKYMDGNVKREKNGSFERNENGYPVSPDQPGYSEEWKKNVVKDTGDKLLVPGGGGH